MTPDELAAELGIAGRTLRAWLRETYPRGDAEFHKPWYLAAEQIAAARARFSRRYQRAESREGMTTTTVALPEAMHSQLVSVAEQSRRSSNEVVREAVGEWLTARAEQSPRLHARFLNYGRRFLRAAEEQSEHATEGVNFPVPQYLAGRAIELALKAHLIHRGAKDRDLRKIGHDLEAALRLSDPSLTRRLDKNHEAAIRMLNPAYSGKELEYPPDAAGLRSYPPSALLLGAARLLIGHLDAIFRAEVRGDVKQ